MNAHSFETLLAALVPEGGDTASAYRTVHTRLMRFFSLQEVPDPGAMADKAMDRLAASLVTRGSEQIASPTAFVLGIARHLLQEERRRVARDTETAREWMAGRQVENPGADESSLRSLDRCLDKMPPERRELLLAYYSWTGSEKIAHHRQLAEKLGLTRNALRNRLLRARTELLECLQQQQRDVSVKNDNRYRVENHSKENRERATP